MKQHRFTQWKYFLSMSWIIARRELQDQLRDWRITTPIVILTLFFPLLMNFTARQASDFVNEYGASIIAGRLLPFMLMVVGFFPISISLVIALESFAGERERKTLEPLLAAPFTDGQLYVGKMIASMVIPLAAAYLGIMVFMTALIFLHDWNPPPVLVLQMFIITAVQAFVMVSGAVVVSSQVTSVRGANLLASFIILPVSQLVIAESLIMFWAQYDVLWWLIFSLVILGILLGRSGLHLFNRELLLGREVDIFSFRWLGRTFWTKFLGGSYSLAGWYRSVVRESLQRLALPSVAAVILLILGVGIGVLYSSKFPLPKELLDFEGLDQEFLNTMTAFGLSGGKGWLWVLWNNIRAVVLSAAAGILSFGTAGMLLLMVPMAILGYLAGNIIAAGENLFPFLVGLVLPHSIIELPVIILSAAAILRFVTASLSPAEGRTIGEIWVCELAEWARIFVAVILPLMIVAAALEIFLTPKIAVMIF